MDMRFSTKVILPGFRNRLYCPKITNVSWEATVISDYVKNKYLGIFFLSLVLFVTYIPIQSEAWPVYARETREACTACHLKKSSYLSVKGLEYAASGYRWPPTGGYAVISPLPSWLVPIVGFIHYLAGFLWFGTILYVHLVLRPAYAEKGLPKTEVMLGVSSMFVSGVTGILLTMNKVRGVEILQYTEWGQLLSVKIGIYAVMILSAAFVVLFIGPKLRQAADSPEVPEGKIFDPFTLSSFDGKDGKPAYIAFEGYVYDVTGLGSWQDGYHFRQHRVGEDLTESIGKAPHTAEKLEGLVRVGTYICTMTPRLTRPQKLFHFFAYFNLALVVVMLYVIAQWEWGR